MGFSKGKKTLILLSAILISGFYILSALGWFAANYMMMTGQLGKEPTDFFNSLNILDHIARIAQVLFIVAASICLILKKKIVLKLLYILVALSLFSTIVIGKWGITFLAGFIPLFILAIVTFYAYWLNKKDYLQ